MTNVLLLITPPNDRLARHTESQVVYHVYHAQNDMIARRYCTDLTGLFLLYLPPNARLAHHTKSQVAYQVQSPYTMIA